MFVIVHTTRGKMRRIAEENDAFQKKTAQAAMTMTIAATDGFQNRSNPARERHFDTWSRFFR